MISGYGIHSGKYSKVFFHLHEGPVSFLKNKVFFRPLVKNVVATPNSTVLGKDGERLAVVEHLLAALHSLNIWTGLLIEVQGDELPILDGSAIEWYRELENLAIKSQTPKALIPTEAIVVQTKHSVLKAYPGKSNLRVEVDYAHPAIGKQSWQGKPKDYLQLLSARTFGFLKDAESLHAAGLATHARPDNVIIFDDEGAMQSLRFPDEVVRHKALDAIGDLYLLGRPLAAGLEIIRGSHNAHIKFVKRIKGKKGET